MQELKKVYQNLIFSRKMNIIKLSFLLSYIDKMVNEIWAYWGNLTRGQLNTQNKVIAETLD